MNIKIREYHNHKGNILEVILYPASLQNPHMPMIFTIAGISCDNFGEHNSSWDSSICPKTVSAKNS